MNDRATGAQPSDLYAPDFDMMPAPEPERTSPTIEPDDVPGQQSGSWRVFTGGMRVIGNSISVFLVQIINKLSTFIAFYIVSIALPLPQFGLYTLVLALRELASAIATFGIDDVLVRMLSQGASAETRKRLLRDAVVLKLLGAVLATGVLVVGAALLQSDPDLATGAGIAGGDLILTAVTASLIGYYRSRLRSSALTSIQAATRVLYVGLLLLGIWAGASWLELLAILLFADAVQCVAVAARLRGLLGTVGLEAGTHKRELFFSAVPLGIASLAILAYTRLDTVLIEQLRGPSEVALYSVCYKITESPLILVSAIAASALPIISVWSMTTYHTDRVTEAAWRALRYSYVIMLPIAVGITFFGKDLIAILYGPAFADVVPAMSVLIWASVAMASNIISAAILTAIRKAHVLTIISLINLAVNIGLNLWAIPQWGYFGSAVATTTTEGLNATMQIVILCVVLRRAKMATGFVFSVIVGAATLVASFGSAIQLSTLEQIGVLCALPIVLALFRFITVNDVRRLTRSLVRALRQTRREGQRMAVSGMRTLAPELAANRESTRQSTRQSKRGPR